MRSIASCEPSKFVDPWSHQVGPYRPGLRAVCASTRMTRHDCRSVCRAATDPLVRRHVALSGDNSVVGTRPGHRDRDSGRRQRWQGDLTQSPQWTNPASYLPEEGTAGSITVTITPRDNWCQGRQRVRSATSLSWTLGWSTHFWLFAANSEDTVRAMRGN